MEVQRFWRGWAYCHTHQHMELFFTDHKLRLIASEICLALQGRIQYAPTFGMAIIAENDLNYFDLVGKNHSV